MFNWIRSFFNSDVQALGVPRSGEWPRIRKEHLVKEPECQVCSKKDSLEVHHIIPFNIDNKKELCDENLITLCEHCHILFGHLMNWKSYNEHVREDARTWQKKIENRP